MKIYDPYWKYENIIKYDPYWKYENIWPILAIWKRYVSEKSASQVIGSNAHHKSDCRII